MGDNFTRAGHSVRMELFVLRHGIALTAGEAGVRDDSERPLSAEGREKMARIAAGMKRVGVEVDLVLSSPFLRAKETAVIAHDAVARGSCLEFTTALASGADGQLILAELKKRYRNARSIMVVGHEPDLSSLIAQITGLGRGQVEMKKGGLAKIAIAGYTRELAGSLEWLVPPKIFLHIK
jgi:phosphohistidine phosphatase